MTLLSAEQLENTPTLNGDHSQRRTYFNKNQTKDFNPNICHFKVFNISNLICVPLESM